MRHLSKVSESGILVRYQNQGSISNLNISYAVGRVTVIVSVLHHSYLPSVKIVNCFLSHHLVLGRRNNGTKIKFYWQCNHKYNILLLIFVNGKRKLYIRYHENGSYRARQEGIV